MEIPENRVYYLLQSFSMGIISPEEEQELYQWIDRSGDDTLFKNYIFNIYQNTSDKKSEATVDWDKLFQTITVHSGINKSNTKKSVFSLKQKWARAAAIIVFILMSAFFYRIYKTDSIRKRPAIAAATAKAYPNTSSAHLKPVLKSGNEQVLLNEKDTSFQLGGNKVSLKSGQLLISKEEVKQYTLTTPRGMEYKVVLADSTVVWLNTASSLTYPSLFTGDTREVAMEGEAYFEVTKNPKKPFIINTGGQRIRVLGTTFNVQAYRDEPYLVTTLITGSLKVTTAKDSILIKPGQETVCNRTNNNLNLNKNADVEQATAWREGYFRFHKADIESIMRQLARWYDLNVVYEPGWKTRYFGGMINRNNPVSKVLHMLEETNDVRFKLKGKTVTVFPVEKNNEDFRTN